jgi:tight adherence protein B
MPQELTTILIAVAAGGSIGAFAWTGLYLFTRGWQGYEEKYVSGMDRTLDAMYLTIPRQHLLYLAALCALLLGALAGFGFSNTILGVIIGALGLPLPLLTVRWLKVRRDKKFNTQLVDALFAMGNALRAGFSLPLAFEMIAREMENPMGQEMRLVAQEMRVGVSMEDALHHLAERMPGEDLDLLITSILISREVGGNLSEVFDNIANTIRDRLRLQGKIRALTAQGKLQGIVVALLPVGIGLALNALNPAFFRPMYTTTMGASFLGAIVVLELIGAWFIRKIVTIKI